MPDPLTLLDLPTERIHLESDHSVRLSSSLSACGVMSEAESAMKSAKTCELKAVFDWKVISYSLSSMVHLVSRLESSGLCSMFFNG